MRLLLTIVVALRVGSALATEPLQLRVQPSQFVGAAGCKSSSCHGGAGEKRSQFITWTRRDIHTRGYATLTNARSERIAAALDAGQQKEDATAATANARCTVCHSPFQTVAAMQTSPALDPTESVSCENCHGAAGAWLRSHTRPDWTYATRVGAGMRDLKSLYVRANTCVACHQNLDDDIAAAGHPPLVFELDGQSVAEPKHWRDPADSGLNAWLTGQAVALRELSWHLATKGTASQDAVMQWRGLAWLLNKVGVVQGGVVRVDPGESFARTQQQADALARASAQQSFSSDFAARLMRSLAGLDAEFNEGGETPHDVLFWRARRLVLALERLSAFVNRAESHRGASPALTQLQQDLRWSGEFNAAQFGARLRDYRQSLGVVAR